MTPMAKKNQSKKHRFKYAEQPPATSLVGLAPEHPQATQPLASVATVSSARMSPGRDFSYVGADLRRIAVMAAGLIAFETVLWYAFGHTGLSSSIYKLFNL